MRLALAEAETGAGCEPELHGGVDEAIVPPPSSKVCPLDGFGAGGKPEGMGDAVLRAGNKPEFGPRECTRAGNKLVGRAA